MLRLQYAESPKNDPGAVPSGVSLRLAQTCALLSIVDMLKLAYDEEDTSVDVEIVHHIGRCCFVKMSRHGRACLDIRDHYFPEKEMETPQPTRRGVRFYGLEIADFLDVLREVADAWPVLKSKYPCEHPDDASLERCYECNARLAGTPKSL